MNDSDDIDDKINFYDQIQQIINRAQEKDQNSKQTDNSEALNSEDLTKFFVSPVPYIGAYDKFEINRNLSRHFYTIGRKINKYIDEQNNRYNSLQSELTNLQNQNLRSSIPIFTRLNSKFWRLYLFTVLKYAKYQFKFLHTLIPEVEKSIKILKKLKRLSDDLNKRPLMVFFLIDQIRYQTKAEVPYRLNFKLESIKKTLGDLQSAISIFPVNFTKENSKDFFTSLITSSQKIIDPITGYLKESSEYLDFVDFVNSSCSPIVHIIQLAELETEEQIRSSCKILQSFASITDKTQISIIGSFCMRYWIDKFFANGKNYHKTSDKKNKTDISILFLKYQNSKILDLKPPSEIKKIFDLNCKIFDFFKSPGTQILSPSPDLLFSCIFRTNPCDIAYIISQINLRISAYVANLTSTGLEDKIVLIGSEFLWKLVIICSCAPCIDSVFDFVQYWGKYQYSPKELFKSLQIPMKALSSLISEL